METDGEIKPRVGVVGLGMLGTGIATCLIRAGRPLAVYDVRSQATAGLPADTVIATSPSEVSRVADVVLIVVVDEAQVRSALWGAGGLMESAREGLSIAVLSTIGVPALLDIAAKAKESGVNLIDCGVTGGRTAAQGGLACMVGGEEAAVGRVRPVLDDFSSLIFHMGPLGAGMTAKIARNLITYGAWHAVYQAGVLAERGGVDIATLSEVIEASYDSNGGLTIPLRRGTLTPMDPSDPNTDPQQYQILASAVGLLRKDLHTAEELAQALHVDLSVSPLARADAERIYGIPSEPPPSGVTPAEKIRQE